ncbi:hypothetical protein V1294_004670 [Bradyrhizobium sp. AZCC 1678]|uniref:hypothetical protein n=1 Tax=Bradyrhizobium sp. AZCC 1678 TaxID=3117030 RepID=UPI002FF21179
MNEFPIEDIHRMLDGVEDIIADLENKPDTIDVADLGELSLIILEIMGWTSTAYMENRLSINPSLLSKFVKMRGTVRKRDAIRVADRVRSFLKSEDQVSATEPPSATQREPAPPTRASYVAEQWMLVPRTSEAKQRINLVSVLLDSIILQVKGTNVPESEQLLTDLERQQLIAILETALNVLKSPLVETGMLKTAQKTLKEASEKAAKGSLQKGLGKLMDAGADRITELLVRWFM